MTDPTASGIDNQPNEVGVDAYLISMGKMTTKQILWANVSALMKEKYGGENLTRLSRDTKIGPGTTTRIKMCETSVGVEVLEKISAAFSVETWQLLAPELGSNLFSLNGRTVIPVRQAPTQI